MAEDIEKAYVESWRLGAKAISIYRDGSKRTQPLNTSKAAIDAYDVSLTGDGATRTMSNRTSYVIAPDGRIVMVHSDLDWKDHVAKTLAAVRALQTSNKGN